MHIYAFGSICRGDIARDSDIDILAIVDSFDSRLDINLYSIYSYERIQEIWQEGNPFAWHLSLESRLLFSSNQEDFLEKLGHPHPYNNLVKDCQKFFSLFKEARASMEASDSSIEFDLSTIFLSIRNIATCFSLGATNQPDFSRNAALKLGTKSIPISNHPYKVLEKARVLCTRGYGPSLSDEDIKIVTPKLDEIERWMEYLVKEAKKHERI